MAELFWWIAYTVCGIWIQALVPGVDCFGPALLLCLQTGRNRSAFWLALPWVLLQEGSGSLPFGTALLYYGGLIYFFFGTRPYIDVESPVFILLCSLFAGIWHFVALQALTSLQGIQTLEQQILFQSLRLTVAFLILWALLGIIYYARIQPHHARS